MSEFKQIMETISPQDAFDLLKEHENDSNYIILDIRPHEEFDEEHITGAKNLDYDGHESKKSE